MLLLTQQIFPISIQRVTCDAHDLITKQVATFTYKIEENTSRGKNVVFLRTFYHCGISYRVFVIEFMK